LRTPRNRKQRSRGGGAKQYISPSDGHTKILCVMRKLSMKRLKATVKPESAAKAAH
jgi:hypothetical protein